MEKVCNTYFADYFDSESESIVNLLSEAEAASFWETVISNSATSYFSLTDKDWIVNGESCVVGNWIDAYNSEVTPSFLGLLTEEIVIDEQEIVYFLVKKNTAFSISWGKFMKYWDCFLAIEDDCSMLVTSDETRRELIYFTPMGDIVRVKEK